ncbi:hypothetical protein [Pseudomonas sp. Pseusp97]|uniref:hypothetical protein n=1 Tax=Pseudomonas sp. Pseusp97 TaxID=3243065 RepID=UPI0039A5141F
MLSTLARRGPRYASRFTRTPAGGQQRRGICMVRGEPVDGEWIGQRFYPYGSPVVSAYNQNYQFGSHDEMRSFLFAHDRYIESDRIIANISSAEIISPQTQINYEFQMAKKLLFDGGLRTFFRDLTLKRKNRKKALITVNSESVEQFSDELSPWTLAALQSIMEGKEVVFTNPVHELYACVEILDFTQKCIFTTYSGANRIPQLLISRVDANRDLIIGGSTEKPIRTHPTTRGGVLLTNDPGSRIALEIGVAINAGTSGTSCNVVIALNNLAAYLKSREYFFQHFSEGGMTDLCHSYLAGPYLINILSDRATRYIKNSIQTSELVLPPSLNEKLHIARSGQSHTLVEVKNGVSGAFKIISGNDVIPSEELLEMLYRVNAQKTRERYDLL